MTVAPATMRLPDSGAYTVTEQQGVWLIIRRQREVIFGRITYRPMIAGACASKVEAHALVEMIKGCRVKGAHQRCALPDGTPYRGEYPPSMITNSAHRTKEQRA